LSHALKRSGSIAHQWRIAGFRLRKRGSRRGKLGENTDGCLLIARTVNRIAVN
jgi:hypothetical protein